MIVTCNKKQLTKKEAQEALNRIRDNRGKKSYRGRKEQRMYQCDECNTWHLTSMDEEEYDVVSLQADVRDEAAAIVYKEMSRVFYALSGKLKQVNKRVNYLETELRELKGKKIRRRQIIYRIKDWFKNLFQ